MASPVCGLRPMRALRFDFTRRPKPGHYEYAVLLGLLDCDFGQVFDQRRYLLVAQFMFLGDVPNQAVSWSFLLPLGIPP